MGKGRLTPLISLPCPDSVFSPLICRAPATNLSCRISRYRALTGTNKQGGNTVVVQGAEGRSLFIVIPRGVVASMGIVRGEKLNWTISHVLGTDVASLTKVPQRARLSEEKQRGRAEARTSRLCVRRAEVCGERDGAGWGCRGV